MVSRVLEILHLVVPISKGVVVIRCYHVLVMSTIGAHILFDCNMVVDGASSSFVEGLARSVEAQASRTLA